MDQKISSYLSKEKYKVFSNKRKNLLKKRKKLKLPLLKEKTLLKKRTKKTLKHSLKKTKLINSKKKEVKLAESKETKIKILKSHVKSMSESLNAQKTKCSRKLYVGNLPTDMILTENMLVQFFTSCLKGLGLKTPMPIINAWINSDQTFAFVEFRGVQDATLALSLCDGLTLGGRSLRFGRAVDFKPPPKHLMCYIIGDNDPTEGAKCYKMPNVIKGTPAWNLAKALETQDLENYTTAENTSLQKRQKSKVLLFENCVLEKMIEKDEDYVDIIEDIHEECINWGQLLQIVVPRRGSDLSGFNRVFVRYRTQTGADKCFLKTNGREFGDQIIKVSYYDEKKFIEDKFIYIYHY